MNKIDLNIEKAYYGNTLVIEDFILRAEKGEKICISGKSGIGKSTVLKILAGLHKEFTGNLNIPNAARVAFVPQNTALLPWKTVINNIVLLKKSERHTIVIDSAHELLASLGLAGYEKRYPAQLSGGQRQRVALGQALFYEPDILLLDEPFSALDEQTKIDALTLLKSLLKGRSITTILVSHTSFEAEFLGCRSVAL